MAASARTRRWAGRATVALAGALPLAKMGFDALHHGLGANPIEEVLNRLGFWTLVFLLLSLVPTALRIVFGWSGLVWARTTSRSSSPGIVNAVTSRRGGRTV